MTNSVKLKRSAVQGKVPLTTDLQLGELAVNTYDGNLFFKQTVGASDSIVKVGTNTNLLSYTRVTTTTTAVSRQSYIADTSGGTFTITLPASPVSGDWVVIADGANFNTTPLTVGRNSQSIEGIAADLSLNISGVSVTLTFDGTTWQVYTQVGAQGGSGGTGTVTSVVAGTGLTGGTITATGTLAIDTAVVTTLSGTQTLTNKTLTSPTINGGTASILTISGSAAVTSNSATDKYLAIGTHGQLFDDGNLHIHTNSGGLWLNSLDGGDINLGLQTNTGTSKAVAKNLSLDAGYGSVAPIYGVRAWISTGYNGSSVTTRGSGNLSMTRAGVGVYTFTFGTAMPDGNYCIQATAQTPGANSDCAVNITNGTTPSTTGFSLTVARYGNGNEDTPILHVQVVR